MGIYIIAYIYIINSSYIVGVASMYVIDRFGAIELKYQNNAIGWGKFNCVEKVLMSSRQSFLQI